MLRRWFTLLLISMLPILTMAQSGTVYPIDLSVMMTPPYGPCLKEYVGSNRINIQALLKDFTKTSNQFVVELKVTDNRNRVVLLTHFGDYQFAAGRTFTYPMGPNADQGDKNNVLHQLFENAKIQPKNECFEEGSYIFTFQAFDAHSYHTRKIALSMPFSYPVFLQGNSVAPLQIYPYENEVLCPHSYEYTAKNGVKRYATQLGGIAYQWQSANPTGMRVGYLLQVVSLGQIGDRTKNNIESEANSMFDRVDRANYTVNVLSYSPFYNHPFTMGNYEEGNAYAWRVFALTGDELNEGENANVKGKDAPARVFYFCGAPGIEKDDYEVIKDDREFDKNLHKVKMDTVKSTDLNALALWRDSSVKDAYCGVNVEIRKKGQEKWTPYFVEQTNKYDESIDPTDNSYTFTNLSYNTRYEVRAQYVKCKECAQRPTDCVYAPYSDILEFVIAQPIDSATCGDDLPKLADCGEGVKAPRILAGDTIIANGTKVVVDSVSYPNASDSSIISGNGHICMPIVKNIQLKMEFEEITINCAKELVKGKIVSVWDDKTCAMIDIDELGGQNSTGGKDNAASDATVEEYDPSTANDKPAGTLMVDKDGTVKFKTKDGKIEDIGKSITLSAQEYQSKGFLSDNAHYIEFYNEDKNNAFDKNAQGYYDKISKYEYFDSPLNKVVLPWLANNPGKIKKIKAREVKKKETIASFESVMFVIPSGDSYIQLDAKQDKDGNYELQIPGWADVDYSTPIYAIARNSAESSYFDAGKMMQANYAERTHKLNIVSLIGDLDASYKTEAEKALNSIYGRVGVSWTVELTKFDNDSIKNEILKDGLSIAADDESCWKKETREMKAIRKLYQNSVQTIDKDAAYLFVVNHPEEDKFKGTEGDMPRSQSVGYIFKDNVTDASKFGRLIAHEIGHGVYKFQHTFDYGVAEKSTDNLMDYNNGDFLAHYQWRVMQDSVMFVWGLFQDDEDGMWTNDALAKKYKEIEEKCRNIFKTAYQKGNNIVYYVLHQKDEYYNDEKSNKDQSPQNTANNHKRSFSLDYFPGVLTYENGTTKIADLNFKIPYELLDNYLIIEPFSETGNFIQNNQQTDAEFIFFLDLQEKVRMCYVNNMDETLFEQLSSKNEDDKSEGLTELAKHVRDNWPGCYEMEDDVKNILISLKKKFRPGQGIEYTANGKNYRLNDKDELETSELSEEDIKTGNFKSSYKEMSRFVRNPSGVIQISAYGINKFTRAFDDKNISLEDLAETYKVLANNYLNENQIKEFDAIIKESESKEFKNGEKIVIAKANAFKILSEVGGIGYTFLTEGIVEQQVYTKNDESIVKIPALVTGSTEQIGQEASDIKDIASFAYNVVFDSNYRNQIPEKFDGMGENPYDSATDVLCSAALGIDKNMLKEIFDENADEGRVHHIESRVLTSITITAIEIALTGGGSILKEAFKKSASSAAKKAEKSFCKRLTGTVSAKMTKEAILKDVTKFAWGAGIEIAIYLAFYNFFKEEDSVFPTEDFLNDAVLAGAANVTDNKTLQSIYACESTVDLNRIMQALNQEGVFAPDYVGADKKEPYECVSEAGAECLLGAGLTYFGGKVTDKFIKWITYLRPSSAMKASDIVHGFVELLDKNVVGTSAFNKWIKTNEGKYFGDRLISILSDVKKTEALKELAAGGFDFKKINDFHTIEELLRLKEYKYVPKELVERLNAVDNSEMLIKMLSLYQKNGKNSAEVMDYFSFEFINVVSDVVNNPELKKLLPNKNIEEMWKYLHEKMTLYACSEAESQIKYVLTDGKIMISFKCQAIIENVADKIINNAIIKVGAVIDDDLIYIKYKKYE